VTRRVLQMAMMTIVITAAAAIGSSAFEQRLEPGNEPGHPSPSAVWINNRQPSEAIPVKFATAPVVTWSPTQVLATHETTQSWEYRSATLSETEDLAAALRQPGAEGWEAVGLTPTGDGRIVVLLKRPGR
jgi:hypothetical protein